MSNKENDIFVEALRDAQTELQTQWLQEDLYRALRRTRQEPGLPLTEIARTITDTIGGDTVTLIKDLEELIKKRDVDIF